MTRVRKCKDCGCETSQYRCYDCATARIEDKYQHRFLKNAVYRYGMSKEDAVAALEQTTCDICTVELARGNKVKNAKAIDHCHQTGEVRGIICRGCNSALGFVDDKINTLQNMQDYLIKYKNK